MKTMSRMLVMLALLVAGTAVGGYAQEKPKPKEKDKKEQKDHKAQKTGHKEKKGEKKKDKPKG